MKGLLKTITLTIVFLAQLSGTAVAASDKLIVRVCSLPLIPQTMPDEAGNPDGYAVKILQAIAQQLHWELKIQYFPWPRVVAMSKNGECDIVLTVLMREDYAEYMIFPAKPILNQKNVFVARKDKDISYNGDLEAFMRSHSVGLYQDKAIDDEFERIKRESWVRIDLANSPGLNMRKLLENRFDAAIENNLTAIYELQKLGRVDEVQFLNPPINVTPAYITFPVAGRLSLAAASFDAALAEFETTDAYRSLQIQYLGVTGHQIK